MFDDEGLHDAELEQQSIGSGVPRPWAPIELAHKVPAQASLVRSSSAELARHRATKSELDTKWRQELFDTATEKFRQSYGKQVPQPSRMHSKVTLHRNGCRTVKLRNDNGHLATYCWGKLHSKSKMSVCKITSRSKGWGSHVPGVPVYAQNDKSRALFNMAAEWLRFNRYTQAQLYLAHSKVTESKNGQITVALRDTDGQRVGIIKWSENQAPTYPPPSGTEWDAVPKETMPYRDYFAWKRRRATAHSAQRFSDLASGPQAA